MSQNAILDRETVGTAGEVAGGVETPEQTPYARAQREHLTLVDWDGSASVILAQDFAPVRPARRSWFGWTEAGVGFLMLASGAAAAAALLRL